MKRNTVLSAVLRGVCAVSILTQVAFAQSQIDVALKQKAELLSPDLAKQIALEREEARQDSEELTTQGIKLIAEGKYREAYHVLTEAVNRDDNNINAKSKLTLVNSYLYDVYAGYGKARVDLKDYESAIAHFRTALDHKPEGKEALAGIRKARQALEESVSKNIGKMLTDDMTDNDKVVLLMKQARDLEIQGRYEEAKQLYLQAINIQDSDPRPRRAYKDLIKKQRDITADTRRQERRKIMEDLIKDFFQHPEEYLEVAVGDEVERITPAAKRRQAIIEQAQTKTGPLSFREASVQEVIAYFADVSKLSIVLNLGEEDIKVDFTMDNPTVLQAIEYICESADLIYSIDEYAIVISKGEGEMETRMWTVSAEAVSRAATATEEEEMEDFDLFSTEDEMMEDEFEGLTTEPEIVRAIKESVPQPEGSTVYLEPTSGTLVVRNTPRNLDLTDDIIRELEEGAEQLQVEIQSKFIQISDEDLDEWMFGIQLKDSFKIMNVSQDKKGRAVMMNPTDFTGALRQFSTGARNSRYAERLESLLHIFGLREDQNQITGQIMGFFTSALTDPEVGVVWKALDMKTNADVLSAPSVTTVSGQSRVNIKQIVEVMYPEDYTVYKPAIVYFATTGGGGLLPGLGLSQVAATYPGYATVESVLKEEIGIELIVSPTIGDDNKTINMEITTRLSKEIDPNIVNAYSGNDSVNPPIEPINLAIPRFRFSEVKTQVVVNDGETIVLGGMVTEEIHRIRDKVPIWGDLPLIGRYFRSESNYQEKVNLLIFVKTRIITPTGESWREKQARELRKEAEKVEEEAQAAPAEEELPEEVIIEEDIS
jgi:type II secretory pathway component GspD/PulD (secretin)